MLLHCEGSLLAHGLRRPTQVVYGGSKNFARLFPCSMQSNFSSVIAQINSNSSIMMAAMETSSCFNSWAPQSLLADLLRSPHGYLWRWSILRITKINYVNMIWAHAILVKQWRQTLWITLRQNDIFFTPVWHLWWQLINMFNWSAADWTYNRMQRLFNASVLLHIDLNFWVVKLLPVNCQLIYAAFHPLTFAIETAFAGAALLRADSFHGWIILDSLL